MTDMHVGITALSSYAPARVLDNAELETMIDTTDAWITTRTGIRERRIAADDEYSSTMARRAVERLRAAYQEDVLAGVDAVIVATNTPDALFPNTASYIQNCFGLQASACDVLAGCPGWLYALSVARAYVYSGQARKVLAIGSEVLSKVIDWEDRRVAVLFGDGAGAAIIEQVPQGYGMPPMALGSDGAGGKYLYHPAVHTMLPDGTPMQDTMYMHGREVFKFAVRVMDSATLTALAKAGLDIDDISLFIPHQANARIIEAARERLGLAPERVVMTVDRYGNTSTASIPIALETALEAGRIQSGDSLLLVSFGAGLTWAAGVVHWYSPYTRLATHATTQALGSHT